MTFATTPDEAHCRRVAAYCGEIATALALGDTLRDSLQRAARLHHTYRELLDDSFMAELLGVPSRHTPLSLGVTEAAILQGLPSPDPKISMLATILEMADQFDEVLEYAQFGDQTRSAMLDVRSTGASECPALSYVLPHICGMSRDELASLAPRLPMFPPAAARALRLASEPDLAVRELVSLANNDPVLSGAILQAANSALYATVSRIRTVQQAIVFLGIDATRRVLLTAALKPLLHTDRVHDLWAHSIEAALTAQAIAKLVPNIDADEAYTVGLLHDIGHLLLKLVPNPVLLRMQRLRDGGVESAVAELVCCGATHAEAGADVLRFWKVPEEYAVAVEFHHEPERCDSPLASLLYVVEFWTASDEDMPSTLRLRRALDQLCLTTKDLQHVKPVCGLRP